MFGCVSRHKPDATAALTSAYLIGSDLGRRDIGDGGSCLLGSQPPLDLDLASCLV